MNIEYAVADDLDAASFIDLLERSGLAERRPVHDVVRIGRMLKGASLVVTARDRGNLLVGVSRCISDFAYCCYCSDLAVDRAYQGRGVGRRLLEESRRYAGADTSFFLISAPAAVTFYESIGMPRVERVYGWMHSPAGRGD